MKTLNTPKMRKVLDKAYRKIRREGWRRPRDGSMYSILYGDLFNDGDHWQVEWIYDTRFRPQPWLEAFLWKKPKRLSAVRAEYHLVKEGVK